MIATPRMLPNRCRAFVVILRLLILRRAKETRYSGWRPSATVVRGRLLSLTPRANRHSAPYPCRGCCEPGCRLRGSARRLSKGARCSSASPKSRNRCSAGLLRVIRPLTPSSWKVPGVKLRGWSVPRRRQTWDRDLPARRGRQSRVADWESPIAFWARGFDVLVYHSQRAGESAGQACTYGFQKQDLRRVLDHVASGPRTSHGHVHGSCESRCKRAAEDDRIAAVVRGVVISDLRTVAIERTPFSRKGNSRGFRLAEDGGLFHVNDVSPMTAAAHASVPTLLIHGDRDDETPPSHSRRISPPARAEATDSGAERRPRPRVDAGIREIDSWLDATLPAAR